MTRGAAVMFCYHLIAAVKWLLMWGVEKCLDLQRWLWKEWYIIDLRWYWIFEVGLALCGCPGPQQYIYCLASYTVLPLVLQSELRACWAPATETLFSLSGFLFLGHGMWDYFSVTHLFLSLFVSRLLSVCVELTESSRTLQPDAHC